MPLFLAFGALGTMSFLIISFLMSGLDAKAKEIADLKVALKLEKRQHQEWIKKVNVQNEEITKLRLKSEAVAQTLIQEREAMKQRAKHIDITPKQCEAQMQEIKKSLELYYD